MRQDDNWPNSWCKRCGCDIRIMIQKGSGFCTARCEEDHIKAVTGVSDIWQ